MSYRELRNFKEIMATLGYPRLISIENFKGPNFNLVAEVLVWLCHRYDKNMVILEIGVQHDQHDRVAFLKSVAEQLLVKARIKLNLKNLYASNGFAVRELLKLASLLHDAYREAKTDADEVDETLSADIGPGHKFADLKLTRNLSTDITKYGARLHELLATHAETKEAAARALGKNFDIDTLQRHLHQMIESVVQETEQMDAKLADVEQDEQSLLAKIDKKKTELDRNEKRLQSLQAVRPAFMDEYERLEGELAAQYAVYVQSWRNLSYLENELDKINSSEQERIAENDRQLKQLQKRLREEELQILRGKAKVDEKALDDALLASNGGARAIKRPAGASVRRDGRGTNDTGEYRSEMYGVMAPMDEESEEEEDGEEESDEEDDEGEDSDGQVDVNEDGDEDEEGSDDEDELDGDDDDPDDNDF